MWEGEECKEDNVIEENILSYFGGLGNPIRIICYQIKKDNT